METEKSLAIDDMLHQARLEGMQKVVDWVEKHLVYAPLNIESNTFSLEFRSNKEKLFNEWQAFLRDNFPPRLLEKWEIR